MSIIESRVGLQESQVGAGARLPQVGVKLTCAAHWPIRNATKMTNIQLVLRILWKEEEKLVLGE